jgi:hypothetical protein
MPLADGERTREIWRNLINQLEKSGKTREELASERQLPVDTTTDYGPPS